MQARFSSARVIVTGGAAGLGLGVARRFVAEGAIVWIADVHPEVERIAAENGAEAGTICDVSDAAAVDALVDRFVTRHGGLDVMVANAGTGGGAPLVDLTDEIYRRVLAINLDGTMFCCRAAARVMTTQRSGVIVTVGSIYGEDTPANAGAYGASKAGVVAMTHAWARELAPHGVRINCIQPGHMDTEMYGRAIERRALSAGVSVDEQRRKEYAMVPLGRLGTGDDMGALVAFLASEDAAYITGQTINLDGGLQPR